MSDRSITKLAIENLELLFTPHGLPIIDKGADAPTTSIAILGDAGAGKTTLAVALAHAIASELAGTVLFLSTELAPTEIKYKVAQLGLGAGVLAWKHRDQAKIGDVIGQHVALIELDGKGPVRTRALEAAWQLLESDDLTPPVRCVVVDAFPLPDAQSAATRDEVVGLVQALESRGISLAIIQEASGATDYIPFITDLVFEMKFAEDPDTGERIRKLACPKSRYLRALVGPHDTGISEDHVSIWPDPLLSGGSGKIEAISIILPIKEQPGRLAVFEDGAIIIGNFHHHLLLAAAPGSRTMIVDAGPLSSISFEDATRDVPASDGAAALIWSIVRFAVANGATLIVLHGLESLLRRRRFRTPLEAGIVSLREQGFVVLIRGCENELSSIADFVPGGLVASSIFRTRLHRTAGLWIAVRHWPTASRLEEREKAIALAEVIARGKESVKREIAPRDLVWLDVLSHRYDHALECFYNLASSLESLGLVDLWRATTSSFTDTGHVPDIVLERIDVTPALLDPAIRALARRGEWDRLDATIERIALRFEFEPWLAARLKADARIEGDELASAVEMTTTLLSDQSLPAIHRAIVLHNRGVARAKLGNQEGARADWNAALAINPELEIAQRCLSGEVTP